MKTCAQKVGGKMIRISISFFYETGQAMRQIAGIQSTQKLLDVWANVFDAYSKLQGLFGSDWFFPAVRSAWVPGQKLQTALKVLTDRTDFDKEVGVMEAYNISVALAEFETVLRSELTIADAYFVSRKAGYDTGTLITNAERIFPADLVTKVPGAIQDIRECGKCLAFELTTASGFHIFRATEAVLRVYWDNVTKGKAQPKQKTLGVYVRKLTDLNLGSAKVRAVLQQIKDLHRNPLIHPQESLNLEEALGLLGICQSAIGAMLKEIATPKPAPLPPATPAVPPTPPST